MDGNFHSFLLFKRKKEQWDFAASSPLPGDEAESYKDSVSLVFIETCESEC